MTRTNSTRAVARQLGLSDTAIRKAEQAGRIVREPDGCWDIERVRRALAKRPKEAAPAPWTRAAHYITDLDANVIEPVRAIHTELDAARQALERAARQIAALYPESLKLERACDAALAAQERDVE